MMLPKPHAFVALKFRDVIILFSNRALKLKKRAAKSGKVLPLILRGRGSGHITHSSIDILHKHVNLGLLMRNAQSTNSVKRSNGARDLVGLE